MRIDKAMPVCFPVWGSVEDDAWAVDEQPAGPSLEGGSHDACSQWVKNVETSWAETWSGV